MIMRAGWHALDGILEVQMEAEMRTNRKQTAHFGVPWEKTYGYAQAVRMGNTIYVAGQLSHDENGNFIAPAALDGPGGRQDSLKMELQMRTTYANAAKILARFGAGLDDVVEEVIYVTDMDSAFAVAGTVRKAAYGTDAPQCVSTIAQVTRLALPQQLVEISFTAVLPEPAAGASGIM
jgi:enamine deaminase RidA (YjgF/YER057c/UK114 family)